MPDALAFSGAGNSGNSHFQTSEVPEGDLLSMAACRRSPKNFTNWSLECQAWEKHDFVCQTCQHVEVLQNSSCDLRLRAPWTPPWLSASGRRPWRPWLSARTPWTAQKQTSQTSQPRTATPWYTSAGFASEHQVIPSGSKKNMFKFNRRFSLFN